MLFLLSPAKTLDYESPLPEVAATEPPFVPQSVQPIRELRRLKLGDVGQLMDLSRPLARLNVARYKAWRRAPAPEAARPAVLAFYGDVYGGLNARALPPDDLQWAQQHLCLLGGLYGVLRPLDRMQPYRLDMGTRLATARDAGPYRVVSFTVKRARGLMARYAIEKRAGTLATLRGFRAEGYQYDAAVSDASTLVFRRDAPPTPR